MSTAIAERAQLITPDQPQGRIALRVVPRASSDTDASSSQISPKAGRYTASASPPALVASAYPSLCRDVIRCRIQELFRRDWSFFILDPPEGSQSPPYEQGFTTFR
jgi:hypothetical protein